jgi:hypothetical protein
MSLSDSMTVAAVAAHDVSESHLEQMSKLPLK